MCSIEKSDNDDVNCSIAVEDSRMRELVVDSKSPPSSPKSSKPSSPKPSSPKPSSPKPSSPNPSSPKPSSPKPSSPKPSSPNPSSPKPSSPKPSGKATLTSDAVIHEPVLAKDFYKDDILKSKALAMLNKGSNACGNIYGIDAGSRTNAFEHFCIKDSGTCHKNNRYIRYATNSDDEIVSLIIYCTAKEVKGSGKKKFKDVNISTSEYNKKINFQLFDRLVKQNVLNNVAMDDVFTAEINSNMDNPNWFDYHELIFICSSQAGTGSRILSKHIESLVITKPTILIACQAMPVDEDGENDEDAYSYSTNFYEKMSFNILKDEDGRDLYKFVPGSAVDPDEYTEERCLSRLLV